MKPQHIFLFFFVVILQYTVMINTLPDSRSPDDGPVIESGAMKALDFWNEQRAYPERVIPDDAFYRAWDSFTEQREKNFLAKNNSEEWRSIGPVNRGGRTIALAVDPNFPDVVYAGSASGGLWRLTLDGSSYSWERIDTGFPVLGVNAIAIDPTNSNHIFIGTGEVYGYQNATGGLYIRTTRGSYGIGLLESTDGGATWRKSIDWTYQQRRGVLALKFNPLNPGIILAGTTEGVYRSADGGDTWELVLPAVMAVDVLIDPVDTNFVYVSCGNLGSPGMGIYRSTEGGVEGSWKKLGGGLPERWTGKTLLAFFESSPNIIYADVADMFKSIGLYRSTDRGDTWNLVSSNDVARYQGWYSHYVRIDPRDENQIIYAGVSFYYSEDGGKTLKKNDRMHVDHHAYANHPTNPDIVYFANDGGVYRTMNGGRSFQALNNGYVTTQFYNGFSSSPTNPDLALGGLQDNSTVMYTGSPQWITGLIGGDGAFTAINPLDNNIMYGSIQWLRIYRSRDRGKSWENISKKLTDSQALFIAPYVLAPSQPEIIYAGKRVVYRSSDGGDTWAVTNASAPLNGMPVISIAVSHTNPDVVYAATVPNASNRAEVFVSSNGGADWTNITDGLPDRYYVDMQVSPATDSIVYITLSGFNTSHLFRSTDRGTSWEDIGGGLPDVPTSAVAIDPDFPSRLYVGNDLGVFVSTNDGTGWIPLAEGLPRAALVMDLSISRANRRIRAVTHGNGVYERPLLTPIVNVEDHRPAAVSIVRLERNYPNPFGPRSASAASATHITFTLARSAPVSLRIFDLTAREIRVLASGRYEAGKHTVTWNGTTGQGSAVASGTYLYQLRVGSTVQTGKLLFLR